MIGFLQKYFDPNFENSYRVVFRDGVLDRAKSWTKYLNDDGDFSFVIPAGVKIDKPVHIVNLFSGDDIEDNVVFSIFLGKGSELKVVSTVGGAADNVPPTLEFQVELEENAYYSHTEIQISPVRTKIGVKQKQNSTLKIHVFDLNSPDSTNQIEVQLNGPGAECLMDGFVIAKKNDKAVNNTRIYHNAPCCHSNEIFKYILRDNSRGVFDGKIIVAKDSQKTIAYQKNNNIVLSDTARINANPQLEIFADDVKCSHGCTVGRLDENALFYLRSRGIPEDKAKALLIRAFAQEILDNIQTDWFRNFIWSVLDREME